MSAEIDLDHRPDTCFRPRKLESYLQSKVNGAVLRIASRPRVHDGQLRRPIEVYRALGDWQTLQRTSRRPSGDHPARPGIAEPV